MIDPDGSFDDPGSPFTTYNQEIFGSPDEYQGTHIEFGTVGWDGEADVADIGDGSDSEDGPTLIRVTLHQGHTPGEPTSPTGAANGYRILAQPLQPVLIVPTLGRRCVVGFPGGKVEAAGSAVILGYVGPTPAKQYGKTTATLDFTGYNLVIRAKSITLRDDADNIIATSPDGGITATDGTGSGLTIYNGVVMLKSVNGGALRTFMALDAEVAQMVCVDGSGAKFKSTDATVLGVNIAIAALGAIMLGKNASAATKVMVGPGPGTTAAGSASIFGQS